MISSTGWTRDIGAEVRFSEHAPELAAATNLLRIWRQGEFTVIVGHERVAPPLAGVLEEGRRWHLSISHPTRYPTWDEIKAARYGLVPGAAWMVQLLPPPTHFHSLHPNCFHLWEVPASIVPNQVPL